MKASRSLSHAFEQQVARTPGHCAVSDGERSLTYAELNRRAEQLAEKLRATGVGPEVLVGLYMQRSVDLLVGIVGILKSGGAYVPLDPAYPASRLGLLLQDSGVELVVTDAGSEPALQALSPDSTAVVVDLKELAGIREQVALPVESHHSAYVVYTSGSTGQPKGVVVEHRQVLRLFEQTQEFFQFQSSDVVTLFHSCAFDFSVWEIWSALLFGGRLVVVSEAQRLNAEKLHELLREQQVTLLSQTPSAFRQLSAWQRPPNPRQYALRHIMFGGEALPPSVLRPWVGAFGWEAPRLTNLFGITETTVHVTVHSLSEADLETPGASPIGVPLPDLSVYLFDAQGAFVEGAGAGEMYVGGPGVARGYWRRPELTASRFVRDRLAGSLGARMYRTGDKARRDERGRLFYLGRLDDQVQVLGHRVELGEVEAYLSSCPGVQQAAVVDVDFGEGDVRLVAWVVLSPESTRAVPFHEAVNQWRTYLGERLPSAHCPGMYLPAEALPTTAHGKVDRSGLRVLARSRVQSPDPLPSCDGAVEQRVSALWQQVLPGQLPRWDEDFFRAGGTSLSMVRMVRLLREHFGLPLRMDQVLIHPTLGGLVACVQGLSGAVHLPGDGGRAEEMVAGQSGAEPVQQQRARLTRLSGVLLGLRSFLQAVPETPRCLVDAAAVESCQRELQVLCGSLQLPPVKVVGQLEEETAFDRVLDCCLVRGEALLPRGAPAREEDLHLSAAIAERLYSVRSTQRVPTAEGHSLRACACGDRRRPCIVLVSACAMPLEMSAKWLEALSSEFYVLSFETRGFEDAAEAFDRMDCSVEAQARDVFSVMDHFGVPSADVLGFCGGAVVALRAASLHRNRIGRLSLWHGDFSGMTHTPSTSHQEMVLDLMEMAGASRDQAGDLHKLFSRPAALDKLSPAHVQWLMVPFATGERLHRYGRLNQPLMTANVAGLLEVVRQPVLVVTSETDSTTHPDGSRAVAEGLQRAQLHVMPHGDHLSLFDAGAAWVSLARRWANTVE